MQIVVFGHPLSIYHNLHSSRADKRDWNYGNSYIDRLLDEINREGMSIFEVNPFFWTENRED